MASLKKFKTDSNAKKNGEWILVGEEYDDLEILTRGITDEYLDSQARRQRKAAAGYGGDIAKLPTAIRRAINVECLIEHTVLGVRNLEDDGKPVDLPQFQAMLRDPDYHELVVAAYEAANKVGRRKQEDIEEALGNSPSSSSTV